MLVCEGVGLVAVHIESSRDERVQKALDNPVAYFEAERARIREKVEAEVSRTER
jgi:hypothetical protein